MKIELLNMSFRASPVKQDETRNLKFVSIYIIAGNILGES